MRKTISGEISVRYFIGDNDSKILNRLADEIEGICGPEGFVLPGTTRFISRSAPYLDKNENGDYDIGETICKRDVISYDEYGNITQQADANGYVTETEWSATYNYALPTESTDLGDPGNPNDNLPPVTYEYDPASFLVTRVTDENGSSTYYEYDDFHRLKYVRNTNNNIIEYYDYSYSRESTDKYNPAKPNRIEKNL